MEISNEITFFGLVLLGWLVPLVLAVWLVLSIHEIKRTLREIRDALTDSHRAQ
jgi:hypothetical protein